MASNYLPFTSKIDGSTACNSCAAAFTHANAAGCAAINDGVNTAAPIVPASVQITGPYFDKKFTLFLLSSPVILSGA